MNTKECTRCGELKPIEEFGWKVKSKEKRNPHCRECGLQWFRAHYKKNRKRYIKNQLERNKQYRKRNRQYWFNYLNTHPCVDCGETDPIVLEFDHRNPKEKKFHVTHRGYEKTMKQLKEEIAKCDIRCSNCHKRKTAKENGWYMDLLPTA